MGNIAYISLGSFYTNANWEAKNEGGRADEAGLIISQISVDSARMLKRVQPAPQGRAHRIRKRSNHVTLVVGDSIKKELEKA